MFPNASVETLEAPESDHYPIWLQCSPKSRPPQHKGHFCYENVWHLEPGFKDLVTNSWQVHSTNTIIPKLLSCEEDISDWKKTHCHNLKRDIDNCRKEMQDTRLQVTGEDQFRML